MGRFAGGARRNQEEKLMLSPLSFAFGALSWSVVEYSLHRFLGHGPRTKRPDGRRSIWDGDFGSEHQAHHTDTRYFSPTANKLKLAVVVVPALAATGSILLGPRRGISFALGFGAAYAGYEILHRRTHTHAPRGAYSRWARRHHLQHHFTNPKQNHGVTSPLWDHVFGTEGARGRIPGSPPACAGLAPRRKGQRASRVRQRVRASADGGGALGSGRIGELNARQSRTLEPCRRPRNPLRFREPPRNRSRSRCRRCRSTVGG